MYFGEHAIRFYPDETYVGIGRYADGDDRTCPETWGRWHLIPAEKPVIQVPSPRSNPLVIPGRHGDVDPDRYVYGRPVYDCREGDLEFIIDPDHVRNWPAIQSDMVRFFQGRERCAVLRDDRWFYYKGLFTVGELTPGEYWDTVSLHYKLHPFKMERWTSIEKWMWDDFDFRQSVIRGYTDISVNSPEIRDGAVVVTPGSEIFDGVFNEIEPEFRINNIDNVIGSSDDLETVETLLNGYSDEIDTYASGASGSVDALLNRTNDLAEAVRLTNTYLLTLNAALLGAIDSMTARIATLPAPDAEQAQRTEAAEGLRSRAQMIQEAFENGIVQMAASADGPWFNANQKGLKARNDGYIDTIEPGIINPMTGSVRLYFRCIAISEVVPSIAVAFRGGRL